MYIFKILALAIFPFLISPFTQLPAASVNTAAASNLMQQSEHCRCSTFYKNSTSMPMFSNNNDDQGETLFIPNYPATVKANRVYLEV